MAYMGYKVNKNKKPESYTKPPRKSDGNFPPFLPNHEGPGDIAEILKIASVPTDKIGNALLSLKRFLVPPGVLPPGTIGVVYTPRVVPCRRNGVAKPDLKWRSLPDDLSFKLYPELGKVAPRCFSLLYVHDDSSGEVLAVHCVQGYSKFGGEACDEDTNVDTRSLLSKKKIEAAGRVVLTEKSNGKAAVITFFRFRENLYVFGGSKNQHYVGRVDEGIGSFKRLNKELCVAWQILDEFFKLWTEKSVETQTKITEKLSRHTACAELEDGRHIIPLQKNGGRILRWFGLKKNVLGAEDDEEGFCEEVVAASEFFDSVGFVRTRFEICVMADLDEKKKLIRKEINTEGYVIHYEAQADPAGDWAPIGAEKYKTWFYIVARAVREFLVGQGIRDDFETKLKARLKKRNRDYMHIPGVLFDKYTELFIKFVGWFKSNNYPVSSIGFTGHEGMGTVLRRFFEQNKGVDDFLNSQENLPTPLNPTPPSEKAPPSNPQKHHTAIQPAAHARHAPQTNTKALIVIQGAPGLGKTFIGTLLTVALRAHGLRAVALEQDAFAAQGLARSGALCRERFAALLAGGDADAVLLLRNNADLDQFRAYADMAQAAGWAVHAVAPRGFGFGGDLRALAVCLAAVHRRGAQHPTFGELSAAKRIALTVAFFVSFRRAQPGGPVGFVSDVDWFGRKKSFGRGRPRSDWGERLEDDTKAELRRLMALANAEKNPFDLKEQRVDAERVARALGLEAAEGYERWRADSGDTVDQIVNCVARGGLSGFLWKTLSAPDPSALYSYAQVPSAVYDSLVDIATQTFKEHTQNIKNRVSNPHVTLIFSDHATALGKYLWSESVRMAREEESVRVVVDGMAVWRNNLICFTCDLFSVADGRCLNGMVQSRHPHITGLLTGNTKPVASLGVLKSLEHITEANGKRKFKLDQAVSFEAAIKIFRKSAYR